MTYGSFWFSLEGRWLSLEEGNWIWCCRNLDEWACTKSLRKQLCRFCLWLSWGVALLHLIPPNEFWVFSVASFHILVLVMKIVLTNCLQTSAKKDSEYWLIWRFEGDSTLADLMQSREFPYNVGSLFHQHDCNW